MTANPQIVEVFTDMALGEDGRFAFVHRDGRPFTSEECELVMQAGAEEVEEAARIEAAKLADAKAQMAEAEAQLSKIRQQERDFERLAELMKKYGHPEATVEDVLPLMSDADLEETLEIIDRL
jgi:hypothetical protein